MVRVHGPGRFLGELGVLTGQVAFFTSVVVDPGEVLAIPTDRLRAYLRRPIPPSATRCCVPT